MSPVCQLEMTLLGDFRGVSGVTVRLMSDGELSRLGVPVDLDRRLLTTKLAGRLLGAAASQLRGRQHRAAAIRDTGSQVSCPLLSPVDKSGRRKKGGLR